MLEPVALGPQQVRAPVPVLQRPAEVLEQRGPMRVPALQRVQLSLRRIVLIDQR